MYDEDIVEWGGGSPSPKQSHDPHSTFMILLVTMTPLTIKRILLSCVDFMALHQQFYTANSMREIFTKVKEENIWAFLSVAGLYRLI